MGLSFDVPHGFEGLQLDEQLLVYARQLPGKTGGDGTRRLRSVLVEAADELRLERRRHDLGFACARNPLDRRQGPAPC